MRDAIARGPSSDVAELSHALPAARASGAMPAAIESLRARLEMERELVVDFACDVCGR